MNSTPQSTRTHWREATFVALDLEGTGPQERENEGIVDIALVLIERGALAGTTYDTLVNPERPIPRLTSRIHGIHDVDVQFAPKIHELESVLQKWSNGNAIVAHNARVDWTLLKRKCPSVSPICVIDTLKLVRAWYPDVSRRGLSDLIESFGIADKLLVSGSKRHRAAHDVLAVAHVFLQMLYERAPEDLTIEQMVRIAGVFDATDKTSLLF